ncbi:MAG: MAPEG family protein [Deltaproteobacteria bacterium]|nr:MAPEG family protein [Deltaproteobacteria bacterium]
MDGLLADPAFQTYAVCTSILAIKMLLTGNYTAVMRVRNRGFVNPEDAKTFGGGSSEQEHPAVAHALRIQRNDLENIPLFWAVGLVFVLNGASPSAAWWYCWTFTIARLGHWLAYLNHLQPWRAIFYGIGYACVLGMAIQIIF